MEINTFVDHLEESNVKQSGLIIKLCDNMIVITKSMIDTNNRIADAIDKAFKNPITEFRKSYPELSQYMTDAECKKLIKEMAMTKSQIDKIMQATKKATYV